LYRICQESLTNILKHAGPDPTVTIVLAWGKSNLRLEVEDDGRGAASAAASDGQGMGLLGMKERAALFGGNVKAGPKPGGGYRVELELPLPEVPDEEPPAPV
jgi:signal transduction histidine kinase